VQRRPGGVRLLQRYDLLAAEAATLRSEAAGLLNAMIAAMALPVVPPAPPAPADDDGGERDSDDPDAAMRALVLAVANGDVLWSRYQAALLAVDTAVDSTRAAAAAALADVESDIRIAVAESRRLT
jgi:hypothetical protein